MFELAQTMSRFGPECPLHWWDGDVGCRRQMHGRMSLTCDHALSVIDPVSV